MTITSFRLRSSKLYSIAFSFLSAASQSACGPDLESMLANGPDGTFEVVEAGAGNATRFAVSHLPSLAPVDAGCGTVFRGRFAHRRGICCGFFRFGPPEPDLPAHVWHCGSLALHFLGCRSASKDAPTRR